LKIEEPVHHNAQL